MENEDIKKLQDNQVEVRVQVGEMRGELKTMAKELSSLREKQHNLSNTIHSHEGKIYVMADNIQNIKESILALKTKLNGVEEAIVTLARQSDISRKDVIAYVSIGLTLLGIGAKVFGLI